MGIVMMLAMIGFTSCDDFLDITPTGKVIAKTGKEYRALLNMTATSFGLDFKYMS